MLRLALPVSLAILALTWWFLGRAPAPVDLAERRSTPEAAAEDEDVMALAPESEDRTAAPTATPEQPVGDEPDADAAQGPRCVVFGRLEDTSGAPLPGVLVQLGAGRSWSSEHEANELESFGPGGTKGCFGFETRSDEDGRFAFDVAAPTSEVTQLYVLPDRFHDMVRLIFGAAHSSSKPPLQTGENDLGTLTLAPTGALFGRVVGPDGAPVEGASIGIGPTRSTTYSRNVLTRPDGSFVLGHAPVGTYGVKAELEGHVNQFREPFTVDAGRDTGPVDFALVLAPSISGRIVDENGAPVADARLSGWPKSSGRGARGRTREDGTFSMSLPQDEPYTLKVTHPDHETWPEGNPRAVHYEPGTSGLDVVLLAAVKTEFRLVDAGTGEPIERFGLRMYPNEGSKSELGGRTERTRPRLEDHAGGVHAVKAREGLDKVLVWAEGYHVVERDVEHDEPGSGVMTFALKPGAQAVGRVLFEGEPVEGAVVEVALVSSRDIVKRVERLRRTTDADGRFAVEGIGRGRRRVTVTSDRGAPIVLRDVDFTPPETNDLGDLEVVAGGTIDGLCVCPAGVDPAGITIYLGHWQNDVTAITDAAGRFRFEGVPPGPHTLMNDERPGILASGQRTTVEVLSGETVAAELNLSSKVLAEIELSIRAAGTDLEGMRVTLDQVVSFEERAKRGFREGRVDLGEIDAEGRVRGSAPALGACSVQLWSPGSGTITHPTARVELTGVAHEQTVEFAFASMKVSLPAESELPDRGQLTVQLTPPGSELSALSAQRWLQLEVVDGSIAGTGWAEVTGREIQLTTLLPGPHTVEVSTHAADAPRVSTPLPNGSTRYGPERLWTLTGEVELVPGEATPVELR